MKYTTIEASREIRLWIGQIFIPAAMTAAALLAIPGVKEGLAEKARNCKNSVKNKFQN